MKKILLLIIIILFTRAGFSHPWKPSHYVIIDTDGGIDDILAINMLLASPDVRVLAITVSGGALSAETAYIKIRSLLNTYHHDGLPLGINWNISAIDMPVPLSLIPGDETITDPGMSDSYSDIISYVLTHEKTPVSFISLGSLNTVYEYSKSCPDLYKQIKEIIWSNNSLESLSGFNYELDKSSAKKILKENVPVKIIGHDASPFYNKKLIEDISGINTRYAENTSGLFENAPAHDFLYRGTDEMIPLFLHYPELFETDTTGIHTFSKPAFNSSASSFYVRILSGNTVEKNQMFEEIPKDTSYYHSDLHPFISEIISRHGENEWQSGVITNELHRHLGVYTIIGVKMGIRALEYFHIGVDEMELESQAGSTPPLSCMNDGLQGSTGATIGHGLIKILNDDPAPTVSFTYMDRTIILSLKKEIADEIEKELRDINYVYGLDSNIYWELVRQKAILLWKNLSRNDIFDIMLK